jgi:hypothetical protein
MDNLFAKRKLKKHKNNQQQPKAEIKIGKFYLSEYHDGKIWLEHESGEGMEVPAEQVLNLIDEYWVANF